MRTSSTQNTRSKTTRNRLFSPGSLIYPMPSGLHPQEKELLAKARWRREQKRELDRLVSDVGVKKQGDGRTASQLRSEYGLKDLGDDELKPLVNLRRRKTQLMKDTGVEGGEQLQKLVESLQEVHELFLYWRKSVKRVRDFMQKRVEEGVVKPAVREASHILLLGFIKDVGGVEEFHKVPSLVRERGQITSRGLYDFIDSRGKERPGYNSLLGAQLQDVVAERLKNTGRVDVLDLGCGECKAFRDLASRLRKEFGPYETVDSGEGKLLRFSDGVALRMVGISRRDYAHPDYVNFIEADIDDADITGRFDEIWDAYGPFTYAPGKVSLLQNRIYPLLKREGTARMTSETLRIVGEDRTLRRLEDPRIESQVFAFTVRSDGKPLTLPEGKVRREMTYRGTVREYYEIG